MEGPLIQMRPGSGMAPSIWIPTRCPLFSKLLPRSIPVQVAQLQSFWGWRCQLCQWFSVPASNKLTWGSFKVPQRLGSALRSSNLMGLGQGLGVVPFKDSQVTLTGPDQLFQTLRSVGPGHRCFSKFPQCSQSQGAPFCFLSKSIVCYKLEDLFSSVFH